MEETAKLQAALAYTESLLRKKKSQLKEAIQKAEYYRQLAEYRWEKLQEVQRASCRD